MSKAKKAKSLIPKTAMQCKMEKELVEDVVDFYYSSLRKKIESLEVPRIGVPILGTFKARKRTLKESIEHLTKILTEKKPENFKKIEKYNLDISLRDKQQALVNKIENDEELRNRRKKDLGQ